MFAGAGMPIERPKEWRSNSYHNAARSPVHSPSASRNSSVSSFASARTDPGMLADRSRLSSATSTDSIQSHKSGFMSIFSKKEKKPKKQKKNYEQLVLTSKHAAAVKTKLMMDPRTKPHVRTAGIISSVHTGHLSAAQQEARHPHSGPPALHAVDEMPSLTRIVSGDEQDDEEELEKLERLQLEWELAKQPAMAQVREHESDGSRSASTSAEASGDEGAITPTSREGSLSPSIEKALRGLEPRRPVVVAKNSYGGRFHKDSDGHWRR